MPGLCETAGKKSLLGTLPEAENYQAKIGNIFTSEGQELLQAVSVDTILPESEVEIEIYKLKENAATPVDGEKVCVQTEVVPFGGYHTIVLDQPVVLNAGEKFSVVEKISKDGTRGEVMQKNRTADAKNQKAKT